MQFVLGRVITKMPFQKHTLVFGFKIWFEEFSSTAVTTLARYRREKQDSVLGRVMTKSIFASSQAQTTRTSLTLRSNKCDLF